MKPGPIRWRRWGLGALLTVTVLGTGYYGARHYAWPAFKTWRVARINRDARAFLAAGDTSNALLAARKSLQSSPHNAEAWHLAAAAAKARQSPEAVYYQDSLCREEPTKENFLELMRLALQFEVPGYARWALKAVALEARADPEFHRLAAQLEERNGQPVAAKAHLAALTALEPGDQTAQLDLAEIELVADPARTDAALRPRILALSAQPGIQLRALRLLLRENITGQVTAGTADLVRRMELLPGLAVADRLLLIEGQFLLGRPEAAPRLAQLQVEVAAQPLDVARVQEFFIRAGRSAEVAGWTAALPAATRKDEDVQRMAAEALLKLHDAPALEALLRGGNWPRREYLREALLAHAYRDQQRSADFSEAWKLALIGAGSDLRKTTALLARVDEWRWLNERHEVVWKLFALVPANGSVQQVLAVWERHQGNTANLNRLFARVLEVQPDNVVRNNYAYTSLLLDTNLARAGLLAAGLVAAEPRNPYFATTYALALFKQGHPAEALARLDGLNAAERTEPMRMLLRALCLAALGRAAPASDLMNDVVLTGMLPEEKLLADGVMTEIARLDRVQGNRTRLLAFHRGQDLNSAAVGWLALVGSATRGAATTDMQLADSLYAAPDWNGLRDLLRATNWKNGEYLRSALLAYVLRREGNPWKSQGAWQQALALADRNLTRLRDLRALVTQWQWAPERLETLNLIFEGDPSDRVLLADLLRHYRAADKTAELDRVLRIYVGANTDPTDEAVAQAYYSLLLDTNIARAHVMARNAFEAAPADPVRRMVYAFSLWKQHRAAEAMPLLAEVKAGAQSELASFPLVRATIQAQMGARVEAQESLAQFRPDAALPEEISLAAKLTSQLNAQSPVARVTPAGPGSGDAR